MSENTAITENAAVCALAESAIEKETARIIKRECGDYASWSAWAEDLLNHGCASGMVSCLVYYRDTAGFFKRHKAAINTLLAEYLYETGEDFSGIFCGKWDADDPLALEEQNQNLLAWFAFEKTVRTLCTRAGVDI